MSGLDATLAPLGTLARATLRVWSLDGEHWRLVAGDIADVPRAPRGAGAGSASWIALPDSPGFFLEIAPLADATITDIARHVVPVVQAAIAAADALVAMGGELAARYQEIDLLYSLGEVLGRARAVEDVAAVVLREVSAIVGARRAALRVLDESRGTLRAIATLGAGPGEVPEEVLVDAPDVVVARAYRSGKTETGRQPAWVPGEVVAVPITHASAGQEPRVVGTIALADRAGGGAFTRDETRLIAAVATQIGAALENARLAARESDRLRLEHELHLARDLQVRLMPTPSVLRGDADVAVRSDPAASIGGDFYTFARLGRGRIGVMLGDVASHGLSAALIAAEVLAAAGIHANSTTPPDEMLMLLRDSLADELEKTEMYLTIVYAILDPAAGRIVFANAGHAHAFRVAGSGPAERLDPTAPPLGLVEAGRFGRQMLPWVFKTDLLVMFTDGMQDQANDAGDRFGERRILACIEANRHHSPAEIVALVFEDLESFRGTAADDSTLLVLRM